MSHLLRHDLERIENAAMAPFASRSAETRGREAPETPDPLRTEFQRDRDRIVHCEAFRKLEYKTQVYVTHEGEYFRTRLTHTIEVAQIARTLARSLALNADLTEAVALAHDLGHTPFGHAGEQALDDLLADEGGFEHNAQSLRVVEHLEQRFHDRPGLNLTWEVREGLACHCSMYDHPGENRYRESGRATSLEAQVVNLADAIAYNHHDLDDAMTIGMLTPDELIDLPWVGEIWNAERERLAPEVGERHVQLRMQGCLMDRMVHDALDHSGRVLADSGIASAEEARALGDRLIDFSPEMRERMKEMGAFLMGHVYRHPTTLRMQTRAAGFFRRLFELYRDRPELLPRTEQAHIEEWGLMRVLTDYMSGMTDRNCLDEYIHQFEPMSSRLG